MKYLITIVAIGILFNAGGVLAQAPETLDEAKQIGETMWGYLERIFGGIFRAVWNLLDNEVEKRKPEAQEEFQKEIQEMKEDIPKTTKTIWERLKDLWN
ncbi:hypothetical protein KKA24_01995 [Patescibacteria group bacterium]|nr:hypothetical protein [Patescibacteria group bacterium]